LSVRESLAVVVAIAVWGAAMIGFGVVGVLAAALVVPAFVRYRVAPGLPSAL